MRRITILETLMDSLGQEGLHPCVFFLLLFVSLLSKMETLPYSHGILSVRVEYLCESAYVEAFFFLIQKKQLQRNDLPLSIRVYLFSTYFIPDVY